MNIPTYAYVLMYTHTHIVYKSTGVLYFTVEGTKPLLKRSSSILKLHICGFILYPYLQFITMFCNQITTEIFPSILMKIHDCPGSQNLLAQQWPKSDTPVLCWTHVKQGMNEDLGYMTSGIKAHGHLAKKNSFSFHFKQSSTDQSNVFRS